MAFQGHVKKAPAPAIDFANLCKADPGCRNPAVWFNKELKIQHCEAHPSDGKRTHYVPKRNKNSNSEDDDTS